MTCLSCYINNSNVWWTVYPGQFYNAHFKGLKMNFIMVKYYIQQNEKLGPEHHET